MITPTKRDAGSLVAGLERTPWRRGNSLLQWSAIRSDAEKLVVANVGDVVAVALILGLER